MINAPLVSRFARLKYAAAVERDTLPVVLPLHPDGRATILDFSLAIS